MEEEQCVASRRECSLQREPGLMPCHDSHFLLCALTSGNLHISCSLTCESLLSHDPMCSISCTWSESKMTDLLYCFLQLSLNLILCTVFQYKRYKNFLHPFCHFTALGWSIRCWKLCSTGKQNCNVIFECDFYLPAPGVARTQTPYLVKTEAF